MAHPATQSAGNWKVPPVDPGLLVENSRASRRQTLHLGDARLDSRVRIVLDAGPSPDVASQ
jgi:hypothetical protein